MALLLVWFAWLAKPFVPPQTIQNDHDWSSRWVLPTILPHQGLENQVPPTHCHHTQDQPWRKCVKHHVDYAKFGVQHWVLFGVWPCGGNRLKTLVTWVFPLSGWIWCFVSRWGWEKNPLFQQNNSERPWLASNKCHLCECWVGAPNNSEYLICLGLWPKEITREWLRKNQWWAWKGATSLTAGSSLGHSTVYGFGPNSKPHWWLHCLLAPAHTREHDACLLQEMLGEGMWAYTAVEA